jgi:N-acetylated-alpha-linked acidic dipeptidase
LKRIAVSCGAVILFLAASPLAQAPPPPQAWDSAFRQIPLPANIKDNMQRLSARPHHVGSPYDKDNAEWILARFKEWGWDASIESFTVLFPTPKERVLELIAPTKFTAKLEEPALANDPTSSQKAEQLPTYNAYSIDGDVTAPLVYVNYGRPADYDVLDRLGISVKGAIVIARYGESWRGIKPKVAAEHGAVGCLIYSDPKDDGYAVDATFSDGPMRPRDGVQRGSVADMPLYPGDPLTPGVGATADAKRLPIATAPTLTKIPVLPISYADAQPLLQALTGPVAPEGWRGALPITYRIGPGGRAHLKLAFNWDIKPVYDVIAKIPGSTYPDEWIVRGNHHDGWVNGAEDPVSGMSAELEEARALGELRKRGWAPKRTIVYAAWDGEEPGLLGSTEWTETHRADLQAHAVVYLNTDGTDRGFLNMDGSHTLERFINDVARDIVDPETGKSVWARDQARAVADGVADARTRQDLHIGALGSGSDFSPFLQYAGVASLDLSFGGEDNAGIYHSIYDDFYFYTHFIDTDFVYERALAQTLGTAVIRLADADLLPFRFTNLAETVSGYVTELKALLKKQQDDVRERNQQITDGVFALINDPKHPQQAPKIETAAPALNFAPLDNAVIALTESAKRYDDLAGRVRLANKTAVFRSANQKLLKSEQQFLEPAGLPGRDWYKHLLYAPGFYTGYGVKTVPGVREAIEQKQYPLAEAEILRVAAAIMREAAWLDAITREIGG